MKSSISGLSPSRLRPCHASHAKEDAEGLRSSLWCFSLSDVSLRGTATTCQLWLVVSSFSPSAHFDMWAATHSVHTPGREKTVRYDPLTNFILLPPCLRWFQALDIIWKHFVRTSRSKTRQKPSMRTTESHLRCCICKLQTESLCCVSLNVLLRHTFFTEVHLCVQVRWSFPFRKFFQNCAQLNHHLIMYPFVMVHFPICFNCSLAGTALMPSKMVRWHVNRPNLSKLTLTFTHSSQYGYRL